MQDYLCTLAAEGQREATRRTRGDALRYIARGLACPPEDVTIERLLAWFGAQDWAPETRRSYRSSARGFFAWAYKTGRVPVYLGDLPRIREPKASPRPVPDDVWQAALAVADPRTTLMLRLAAQAGLRRAEVAQVHTRDVVFIAGGGAQLVVHGKGGRQRLVPLPGDLAEQIRQLPPGWVFPDGFGGHLSPAWVGTLVSRVLPEGTMHALRHRFGTRAYRGTRNLRAVQQLLGHASVATTERYVAVDDDEIRAAATYAW
ncbi:hypothetical protein ABH37_13200 [Mycobacterium haemophilum]|uniref:Integrase n=1 Tax=Mycobacterium haemophilum TaxID=29311 RepID=A0A0I9UI43_9MYCO|nr:hypothetical protein ABH39_12060 [Mycobacterium haemophilum]KLO36023.1 hypothetical protein ABH38_13900 [Mycobacterium haemophilum]KLO41583.1 hypothetical protein ABH37_13200 [Mycobacterium haemophilum]KLO49462.1 hypothetical protein ABH36_12460 [Mycobacterium haemophilum]